MNFTTPYNTSDFFFTKEEDYIQFNTPLNNTYFEMTVAITSYEFYTELPTSKILEYKIPLFNNKGSFLLGEVIDRSMTRIKEIDLRSLFQYKAAQVQLTIKEIDFATQTVLNATSIGPIKFVSGYIPEVVQNNCAFLDLYDLPRRVIEDGYAFINMILTPGAHNFKVFKNNIEVATFNITVVSNNICSRALKLSDYTAKKGDTIEVRMTANPNLTKTFYVFPATFYSNYIAFEDEFRLKTIIECTGEYRFTGDLIAKMNKIQKGIMEFNRKISSKTELSLIINTGFVLEAEELLIESLLGSKRAWLIIGENQGIELVPISKKIAKFDPTTALYSYDVEFMVNPKDYKPLKIEMDKPLLIQEIDTIAPTTPLNLTNTNTTTTGTTLQWQASSDAYGVTGYDIYKGGVYLATTLNLSYGVTGLVAGTAYSFTVKAKDAAGNFSNASNILSVTTPATVDTIAPTQPTNLTASEITTNSLKLTWTAATDNVGVSRYNIYKNGVKIGEAIPWLSGLLEFNVNGLFAGSSYSFYVTAQDAAENVSVASASVSATTLANSTSSYFYEGFYLQGDQQHSNGGSVTYVNSFGVTVTDNGFFNGTCTEVVASSIISTNGVGSCGGGVFIAPA
jgi:chitodextrinase